MHRPPPIHRVAALPLLALFACGTEGEDVTVVQDNRPAACDEAFDVLADGLQTGDEILLTFQCVNVSGTFDPFVDVLTAMNESTDQSGTSLLDRWVSVVNEELTNAEGGPVTVAVTPTQLAEVVGGLAGFFDSGAPEVLVELGAEAVDAHVADAAARFTAVLMDQLAHMDESGGPSLREWLDAVGSLLCTRDPSTGSPCRSALARFMAGAAANATSSEYDPSSPTNDDLQQTLAWLLYAGGDISRASESADALAAGLAELAKPVRYRDGTAGTSPMEGLFTELLPALFGDDRTTPYVYEGYPSHNPKDSALYGIMDTLRDPTVQDALAAATDETRALVFNYYEAATYPVIGNAVPYRTEECKTPFFAQATNGVANNGVEQLVRLFSATNVSYKDNATCTTLFAPLLILGGPYLDVSGSTTVGSLILEFSAVLPIELLKLATAAMNTQPVVDLLNTACGMHLQLDDVEVLEALVYFPYTPVYSFPLLGALTDVGKVDDVVDYLDHLWQSQGLCKLAPTLRLAMDPDAPQGDGEGGDINDILPDPSAPIGTTYHDQVIEPLLEVLMDAGVVAPTLLTPLRGALISGDEELVNLLLNLGSMANDPDSALGRFALVQAELSQLGGGGAAVDLGPAREALDRDDLVELAALTLSAPAVVDALTTGIQPERTSVLEAFADQAHAGTLGVFLNILGDLLDQLNVDLEGARPQE